MHRLTQRPLLNVSALLGAGLTLATAIAAPVAMAAGTTGDFGKRLNRTTSLHHFQVDKEKYVGQRFEFECPATHVRDQPATLYGTGSYPANSPICVAALHAGAVGEEGGPLTLQLNPGRKSYEGSEQFGIESKDLPGTSLSIAFLLPETRAALDALQAKWKPRLEWDDKFSQTGLANIRLTGQRFAFDCPTAPSKLAGRRVYGTDSYPLNSYVCLAAVHAGQISKGGGDVLVQMDPAPEGKFVGSSRNGIESKNGPKSPRSITFPGGGNHGNSAAATAEVSVPEPVAEAKRKLGGMLGRLPKRNGS